MTSASNIMASNKRNNKKIEEVKEVIQNKADSDIVKILEVFENDVAKTINAFMTDGGKDALSKWVSNKKKNNSKQQTKTDENLEETSKKNSPKKMNKKASTKTNGVTASNGTNNINDLVSSIINQSINTTVPSTSQTPSAPIINVSKKTVNGDVMPQQNILDNLNNLVISSQPLCNSKSIGGLKVTVLGIEQPGNKISTNQSSVTTSPSSMSSSSTFDNNNDKSTVQNLKPDNRKSTKNQFYNNINNIDRNQTPHPLLGHLNASYINPNNKNLLDKSQKDLQRQSAQLTKISSQFQAELNKSQMSINQTFLLLHNLLDQRQAQLQNNLNSIARTATQTLIDRQHKANQLKTLAENVIHLNDQDTLELKADIKHFISERLLDEEYGKVKLFNDENYDKLHDALNSYGEVNRLNHIKYASKRPPLDEVLNNNFTATVLPKQTQNTNKNSYKANIDAKSTNGKTESKQVNGKFSVKITDVNGFSDENIDEGEFIEVKKPQRNKNKQPSTNGANGKAQVTNGAVTNNQVLNNASNGTSKKQKKKQNNNVNANIPKANQNPFSLIANGHIN